MTAALPKPHKDRGMEGMVAKWYTTNTGKSISEFAKLARQIAKQLPSGSTVLEVAPGPGYFCIELAKLGDYAITGLDISHTFVEIAGKKAAEAGVHVDFRQGNASSMPLGNDTFDFLPCRAAFKNFGQPVRALQGNMPCAEARRPRPDRRSKIKMHRWIRSIAKWTASAYEAHLPNHAA
jgi:ubiquinone/menaquinone biosynthesis C-methylase UbiE